MRKFLLLASSVAIISNTACSTKNSSIGSKKSVSNTYKANNLSSYTEQMLSYINKVRANGAVCAQPAGPLQWSSKLEQAAKSHVKDMALNDTVSHIGSGTALDPAKSDIGIGSTFIDRIKYFGYNVKTGQLVGENLTKTYIKLTKSDKLIPNFKRAITNLINDKPHCEIIMNPRFNDVGMAMFKRGDMYYFTMELAQRP